MRFNFRLGRGVHRLGVGSSNVYAGPCQLSHGFVGRLDSLVLNIDRVPVCKSSLILIWHHLHTRWYKKRTKSYRFAYLLKELFFLFVFLYKPNGVVVFLLLEGTLLRRWPTLLVAIVTRLGHRLAGH